SSDPVPEASAASWGTPPDDQVDAVSFPLIGVSARAPRPPAAPAPRRGRRPRRGRWRRERCRWRVGLGVPNALCDEPEPPDWARLRERCRLTGIPRHFFIHIFTI